MSAVSSDLSGADLTSAFHEACSSAPNSTASVTGSVSASVMVIFVQLYAANPYACSLGIATASRTFQKMREVRGACVGLFRLIVPLTQFYRIHRAGLGNEVDTLLLAIDAALQFKAAF